VHELVIKIEGMAIVHPFFVDIDIDIFVNCNWVDTRW